MVVSRSLKEFVSKRIPRRAVNQVQCTNISSTFFLFLLRCSSQHREKGKYGDPNMLTRDLDQNQSTAVRDLELKMREQTTTSKLRGE